MLKTCAGAGAALAMVGAAAAVAQDWSFEPWARPIIEGMDAPITGGCPSGDRRIERTLGRVEPLHYLGQIETAAAGFKLYKEEYRVSGCARPARAHNIYVWHNPSREPVVMPSAPGGTRTVPEVQADLFPAIRAAVAQSGAPCPPAVSEIEVAVMDTAFLEGAIDSAWREQWTVRACGTELNLGLRFTYDDGALSYAVEAGG